SSASHSMQRSTRKGIQLWEPSFPCFRRSASCCRRKERQPRREQESRSAKRWRRPASINKRSHMVGAEVTELIQGYVVARQLETTEAELMKRCSRIRR